MGRPAMEPSDNSTSTLSSSVCRLSPSESSAYSSLIPCHWTHCAAMESNPTLRNAQPPANSLTPRCQSPKARKRGGTREAGIPLLRDKAHRISTHIVQSGSFWVCPIVNPNETGTAVVTVAGPSCCCRRQLPSAKSTMAGLPGGRGLVAVEPPKPMNNPIRRLAVHAPRGSVMAGGEGG